MKVTVIERMDVLPNCLGEGYRTAEVHHQPEGPTEGIKAT